MTIYHLGNLTFGGYVLFETATELCVWMHSGIGTVRIPKKPLDTTSQ